MNFDISYFEDEVRGGFPIVTMIKRGWAAGIRVLEEVDRICRKHDIKYFVIWGTLLGAVRHKGFIPWDDDIDIGMKRADYMRFLEIAPKELPEGFSLHNVFMQDRHGATLTGIFNTLEYRTDEQFLDTYYGCPAAIGLDIVAYDYLPREEREREQLAEALDFLVSLIAQYDELDEKEKRHQLKLVETTLGTKIKYGDRTNPPTFQLGNLLEKICMMYTDDDSDELTNMMVWQHAKGYHFPKHYFDDHIDGTFEGMTVPMPLEYDKYLTMLYGDYMVEVRDGSSHSYPYFHLDYLKGYSALGAIEYEPKSMPYPRLSPNSGKRALIIFLVSEVKHWKYMEKTYNRVVNDRGKDADIYVMPLPYAYKNMWGEVLEWKYDGNRFPEGLQLVDYEEYELDKLHPDVIYFQDPYDEWNDVVELPTEYRCEELWTSCNELILVPVNQPASYPKEDERATKMLFNMVRYPGYIMADRICIEDVELRRNYLDVLLLYTGEATKNIWMNKLGIDGI